MLLLHGFPDTAHTWDELRPRIAAKGYRAVSPFMRGYAPSGIPDRDTDQETLARDALALIEALGASEAIVIGHDFGAAAAYGAAGLGPDRVKKLFTIAIPHPAALKPSPKKLWGVRHFAIYKLPGAPKRFAHNDFAALPAIYRRWSPTWNPASNGVRRGAHELFRPGQLECGVRLLPKALPATRARHCGRGSRCRQWSFAGLDDPVAEPSDYRGAARMFENEYIVEEVPGGHFMHREHPDVFAERILTHL